MTASADARRCPCGSGDALPGCCGRFLHGSASAPTAVALMRSRYSAFSLGDADYLLRTWHPSTRPRRLDLDPAMRWTGLTIVETGAGGLFDRTGTVAFRARYRSADGSGGELVERSRFQREGGQWLYVDGVIERP